MSRRKSSTFSQPWVKNILVILVVIIVAAGGVFALLQSSLKDSLPFIGASASEEEEEELLPPENVSSDIVSRLSEGTALLFGATPEPGKPVVSIVGDPEELSRSSYIVNGKPSDFMNAVNESKLTFYYYPVGKEGRQTSTDSITRASVCRIGAEKTTTGIFTLTGIVSTGDKVEGSEDVAKVSSMMGMAEDVKCPVSTNEASTQTSANADFFAEHFGLGREGKGDTAIVVGDEVITHPENLPANWAEMVLEGKPLREIIKPASEVESPTGTVDKDTSVTTTTEDSS